MGGPKDFSVSPSLIGSYRVIEFSGTWLGLVLLGLGTKGFGPGLDNS